MKPQPPAHLRHIAEHWPAIEKTLPAHANRAAVRQGLEEIAAKVADDALSSKKLVGQFETRARLANQLISALGEDNSALVESLIKQRDVDRQAARVHDLDNKWYYPRLPQLNFRWAVFVLWDAQCGKVTAHTRGAHIDFFRAVSLAIFGKAPKPRQVKDIIRKFRLDYYFV